MPNSSRKLDSRNGSAAILYRRLCNRAAVAHSLDGAEVEELKVHCFALVADLSREIVRELQHKRPRAARRAQVRLFESLAARLVAAWQAAAKFQKRHRRELRARGLVPLLRPQSFSNIWILAEQLKNVRAPASVTIYRRTKRSGGFRTLHVPDRLGIAKQHLLVNAIKPFASFHPSQFALRRGRSAACESLLRSMNEPALCNTRFVQFDVVDFFSSISREYVEEVLPAPKNVIRNTLFLEGWTVKCVGRGVTTDRRGLPQGLAASSLVAEIVMANVLRDIAGLTAELHCIHAYSDNWGGFLPHDRDAGVLVDSLKHAFETHRAGPYRITSQNGEADRSFKFLGYYFKPPVEAPARVSLPKGIALLKEIELTTQLYEAESVQEVLKLRSRFMSFCGAYILAPETRRLRSRMDRLIAQELNYRGRTHRWPQERQWNRLRGHCADKAG